MQLVHGNKYVIHYCFGGTFIENAEFIGEATFPPKQTYSGYDITQGLLFKYKNDYIVCIEKTKRKEFNIEIVFEYTGIYGTSEEFNEKIGYVKYHLN